MAKKLADRLATVLKIAKSEYDKALKAYSQLEQQYLAEVNKCQSLKAYRKEYVASINQTGQAGMKANELQVYFRFIHELDNLCDKQHKVIERIKQEKESAREFYLKAKQKADSLEKIIEKEDVREAKKLAKSEQKALDELSQKARNGNTLNSPFE